MNAKNEFLKFVILNKGDQDRKIKCAYVTHLDRSPIFDRLNKVTRYDLRIDYSKEEYNDFLDKLNFDYDSGFGLKNVEGIIWFNDDTWAERIEYDGSEWWYHHKMPKIPAFLRKENN